MKPIYLLTPLLSLLPLTTPHPTTTTPPPDNKAITPGHATIHNNCTTPIYIWSVSSTTSPQYTIPATQNYSEIFHHDAQTGGVSIKITTVRNGLYTGSPQMIFAYNLVNEQVWFDLSDVFGDPFRGRRVTVGVVAGGGGGGGGGEEKEMIVWEDGVPVGGSQVRVIGGEGEVVVRVCA
ncbi:Bys1 family protein [Aspergillus ibericus CBS 121593]|uniref:Bys1 family protein n=1 Tax=Aspergillus ibericus CBS 121593 TaxID=1448316 RepID=A0A395GPW2_9EURO|nr:hypothetical protein BO80DRAFT_504741 [Aspergillus ibericus CBS 121593]RAK97362.1 hypothetical protein BO80DRAFT_504741 [Aspergillus ibericus CBS 121593]